MVNITVIYGPTASGKTALALEIAAAQNGVIINADSMQIYDALPVLTAQPSAEEIQQAPHKLYAALDPAKRCSAQSWRDMAASEIEAALAQNQTPIIVGGTGLYLKALIKGLSPMPVVPDETRTKAMAMQKELGNPAFHSALAAKDAVMAEKLHPNDTQRLIRAWEVLEGTGKSLAHWQAIPPSAPPAHWNFEINHVNPDRALLYERCNTRFDTMLELGILDEVKALDSLIELGKVPADAPITHALGFHPFQSYLRGMTSLDEAIDKAKQETRNYAKRQITWFKNQF